MYIYMINTRGGSRNLERGGPEAIIYKIWERRGQNPSKWLLNVHSSCFLIYLLQIFYQKGGKGRGGGGWLSPPPQSATEHWPALISSNYLQTGVLMIIIIIVFFSHKSNIKFKKFK